MYITEKHGEESEQPQKLRPGAGRSAVGVRPQRGPAPFLGLVWGGCPGAPIQSPLGPTRLPPGLFAPCPARGGDVSAGHHPTLASLRPRAGRARCGSRARQAGCAGSCGGATRPGVSATSTPGYAQDSRNCCVFLESSLLLLTVKGLKKCSLLFCHK